ncbi:hypothetical protein P5673_013471 [Acropora cervicornis]|uniref:Uncharacterized protein n=1 Tax=Acropora cervicornis TaxID=6130 RepID=A0AAD9QKS0_ACRCE|nr:hypothetical protein P5673_013471 [Acropora cervicornis]
MVTSRPIVNNRQERKWNRHVAKKIIGDEQKNSGSENMKSVIDKRFNLVQMVRDLFGKLERENCPKFTSNSTKPEQLHPSQRILLLQLEHKALWTGRAVTPANAMPQLSAILATPIENSLCSGLT